MLRQFSFTALATACLAVCIPQLRAAHWSLQYFYDEDHVQMNLIDLACPSAQRCVAVGWIQDIQHPGRRPKPVSLVSSDGGEHWAQIELKDEPRSLFFLNDSLGWMVTEDGIWQTQESGRSWRKIGDQEKPNKKIKPVPPGGLILQVSFLNEQHGFAVGYQKSIFETQDGGRTWKPVPAAAKPQGDPAHTAYSQIDFSGSYGIIVGTSLSAFTDLLRYPAWMDPARASIARPQNNLTFIMQSFDKGANWNVSTVSRPGSTWALHLVQTGASQAALDQIGLFVFRNPDSAEFPSEVFRIDAKTGDADSVFRNAARNVTDAAIFPGHAYLAAVEPPGKLSSLPIPGKVKMIESNDLKMWTEMDVDYRAVATALVMSGPDPQHMWAATDTGMILKLVP